MVVHFKTLIKCSQTGLNTGFYTSERHKTFQRTPVKFRCALDGTLLWLKTSIYFSVKCLICPKEIGPLQYHSTIKQIIPDLDEQDRFSLNSTKVPTLKQIVLYSTTANDEAAGYFKFSELYDMADSNHLNQAKNIKVE